MGTLKIWHPDIEEFITCKNKLDSDNEKVMRAIKASGKFTDEQLKIIERNLINQQFTNFNLSVIVNRDFLRAVENDEDWVLYNPKVVDGKVVKGEPVKTVKARKLWDIIVNNAWENGDPGILYEETLQAGNPLLDEPFESTNPCSEQPLSNYESCNLGSIDLAKHIKFNLKTQKYEVDFEALENTITVFTRMLDNVIDVNSYPLPIIKERTQRTRKIGMGVMGWANLLFLLGIPYDSEEAVALAEQLSLFIQDVSHSVSMELGKEKGTFPAIENSIYKGTTMRNATTTTIAPTGSIAILADTSGGIEPEFALAYKRLVDANTPNERIYFMKNKILEKYLEERKLNTEEVWNAIIKNGGRVRGLDVIPEDIQRIFATSMDIDPLWHMRHQSAWQKGVDNAVSKTINLPSHATREDIEKIYLLGEKLGLKGITIYRDGSKFNQVLSTEGEKEVDSKPVINEEMYLQLSNNPKNVEYCPSCGAKVNHESGCWICPVCGTGKCAI